MLVALIGTRHWHTIEFFEAMPMGFGNSNCRFGTIKVCFVSISTNTRTFSCLFSGDGGVRVCRRKNAKKEQKSVADQT